MGYIVPRDRPAECRKCPFCDRYTYDCRLQRESYESFEEQIAGCPLTACAGIGSVRADAGGIYLDGQDATVEIMRAVMTYMILQLKEDNNVVDLNTITADRWQARLVLEVFPPDMREEEQDATD